MTTDCITSLRDLEYYLICFGLFFPGIGPPRPDMIIFCMGLVRYGSSASNPSPVSVPVEICRNLSKSNRASYTPKTTDIKHCMTPTVPGYLCCCSTSTSVRPSLPPVPPSRSSSLLPPFLLPFSLPSSLPPPLN